MTRRWLVAGWVSVAVVFMAIRVWAFRDMGASVFGRQPLLDAESYFRHAAGIAAGHWQQETAYFFGPAWPWLLGVWFKIAGVSMAAGRVLNMLLGAATVGAVAFAAHRTSGRWAGLAAGAVWTCLGPMVLHEQTLLMEAASACASAMLLAAWCECWREGRFAPRPAWGVVVGLLLGANALFRANMLVLAPTMAAFGLWALWKTSERVPLLRFAAATGVAMVAAILPATIHNYRAEGIVVPITSNLGVNLWAGIGPQASGRYVSPPSTHTNRDLRGAVAARAETGRELNSAEISRYWASKATEGLTPTRLARLTAIKLWLFLQPADVPQIYSPDAMQDDLPFLRAPLPGNGLVVWLFLAATTIVLAKRDPRAANIVVCAWAMIASLLPFFIVGRYRLPVAPWMLVAGVWAVAEAVSSIRRREKMWMALAFVPGIVLLLFPAQNEASRWQSMQMKATLLANEKNYAAARALIAEVNAHEPTALSLSTEATIAEEADGDFARAADLYERALGIERMSALLWFNAAQAQLRANRPAKARESYGHALALDPEIPPVAWYNLALLSIDARDDATAAMALREYVRRVPEDVEAKALLEEREATP